MIGAPDGMDTDKLKHAFDGCIGNGDEARSPILRVMGNMAAFKKKNESEEKKETQWN